MEKSAKMVLVLALFLAAVSGVPSEGRNLPKPEKPTAYHPQNFIGSFGGGVFTPGAPPIIGGGTVYLPLIPPGFGLGGSPFGAGGIPGVGSQPGLGLGGGGIGGVRNP